MRILKLLALCAAVSAKTIPLSYLPLPIAPPLPSGTPIPAPSYMQDNVGNAHGAAPDKGFLTGPVIEPLSEAVERILHGNGVISSADLALAEAVGNDTLSPGSGLHEKRQSGSSYWLADITHGMMPYAPSNYTFFRNVMDYGAKGDGVTDDTAAINRAISSGGRCGANCGSTTTTGALVYFPAGTYLVSTPIIQYYYTQFVGNPNNLPILKGSANFSGIAIVDDDPYIPGGNGNEWYINQNQFYRQIRNFKIDLTSMPISVNSSGQMLVPTGIHWQVAQATSLQNLHFIMPQGGNTTHVGIFMENGSGGFVSDLTFFGGAVGFRAGSQQFTARNLEFTSCLVAIEMIWDWGFTWQNIQVTSCYVALNCTGYGGAVLANGQYQGTGSISVIDSIFNGVPYAITTHANGPPPNIVLDNLLVQQSAAIVLVSGGATIFPGSTSGALLVQSWAMGRRYVTPGDLGNYTTGDLEPVPSKPSALLANNGTWFAQSKPQYANLAVGSFVVATAHGISNAATGDQTAAINTLLANNVGSPIFFPAGIYLVKGTVKVPVNSIIVGEGWSQIMATGSYFANQASPQVVVQVGKAGDFGSMQISDMLFTVQGNTAGAILVEWNVHENSQGSVGMWDSHFRVGGANGTNLSLPNCPASTNSTAGIKACSASSMLMHVTSSASGYFENIWAWVADHDLDSPLNAGNNDDNKGVPLAADVQISIFGGRGLLIESKGPTWLWGTSAEHSVLYQYQLLNAENIFLSHMQTETPYYQPGIPATQPYTIGQFASDPTFEDCQPGSNCEDAWALRVLNSSEIFIYTAGFYSFFNDYVQTCANKENCQLSIVETSFTQGLWIYNLFTKGVIQIVSPDGNDIPPVFQNDSNQSGFTSEISAWLALSEYGANEGSNGSPNTTGSGVVYIGPQIWTEPAPNNISCYPPCTIVFPPLQLSTTTTISFPLYTTTLDVGWTTTSVVTNSAGSKSTTTTVAHVLETTTITIPPVTTTAIPVWNWIINSTVNSSTKYFPTSSIPPQTFVITDDPDPQSISGVSHTKQTRTITVPPYPYTTRTTRDPAFPVITYHPGPPGPQCAFGCGHLCLGIFCHTPCLFDCGGGGFADPDDPNPLPNPNPGPAPNNPDEPTKVSSCSTATVTDYFVSCTSINLSSTSCTTTSSEVESGCGLSATAYTTGVAACLAAIDYNEDEGQDGLPPTASGSAGAPAITGPGITTFNPVSPTVAPTSPTSRSPTSTTPTMTPPPVLPSRAFQVFNVAHLGNVNGINYDIEGFDIPATNPAANDGATICNLDGIAVTGWPENSPKSYPSYLVLNTALQGRTSCTYTGVTTAPGHVTCGGPSPTSITCTGYPSASVSVINCSDGAVTEDFDALLYCNY